MQASELLTRLQKRASLRLLKGAWLLNGGHYPQGGAGVPYWCPQRDAHETEVPAEAVETLERQGLIAVAPYSVRGVDTTTGVTTVAEQTFGILTAGGRTTTALEDG